MGNYVNDNLLDASPYKKQADEAKALVNKWDKTGLLDGLNEEFQRSGMAVMLENQARQLISENSSTGGGSGAGSNTAAAGSEEWSGVALPLVRRIFGEIAAQDFVSVQPMNLPSGLVFYLDFKYGKSVEVKMYLHLVVKQDQIHHRAQVLHMVLVVFMVLVDTIILSILHKLHQMQHSFQHLLLIKMLTLTKLTQLL
jgi:hypothetical protein